MLTEVFSIRLWIIFGYLVFHSRVTTLSIVVLVRRHTVVPNEGKVCIYSYKNETSKR